MKIIHALMRFYSYLFTLFISVFLGGIGVIAFISDQHNWKIDTFIWSGKDLSIAMLILGVMGGASVLLAFFDWFRALLPVVALIFFGLMIYGFFWSPYKFADGEQFQWVAGLAAGAAGDFLCSLMLLKRRR